MYCYTYDGGTHCTCDGRCEERRAALRQQLARIADWFRALREQLTALAHRLTQALRPLGEQLRGLAEHTAARRHRDRDRDRPAWCSPYGPAPRGRRR
jgi:hypothetical protein